MTDLNVSESGDLPSAVPNGAMQPTSKFEIPVSRGRRWVIRCLKFVAATVAFFIGYGILSDYLVNVADAKAIRDPDSSVLMGAQPCNLGPSNSDYAVLFIHGCVGAGNNFNHLPETMAAAGWRVRVMRLPGHGTSPRDFEKTTKTELLEAVRSELLSLRSTGAKSVILVGHSMGGTLATLTAAELPIDGLVLGGSYFGVTHHWFYGFKPETWHSMLSPAVRWIYKGKVFLQCNRVEVKPEIVSYAWVPTRGLTLLQELGRLANRPQTLEKIRCPVLMLHGPGDQAASFERARHAFEQMPASRKQFVELSKSNHHIFWDWEAEKVEAAVLKFAAEIAKPPANRP